MPFVCKSWKPMIARPPKLIATVNLWHTKILPDEYIPHFVCPWRSGGARVFEGDFEIVICNHDINIIWHIWKNSSFDTRMKLCMLNFYLLRKFEVLCKLRSWGPPNFLTWTAAVTTSRRPKRPTAGHSGRQPPISGGWRQGARCHGGFYRIRRGFSLK